MNRLIVLAVTILLLNGSTRGGTDSKKELANLEGVWEAASATQDGKKAPEGKFGVKLTIKGDQFTFLYNAGRTIEKGKLKLNTSKTPKEITLQRTTDDSFRKWIYELRGDTLTVCFSFKGKQPTQLDAKAGSGNVLIVWKKAK
jgi:uncharacterized protein (TIGR03067 family)